MLIKIEIKHRWLGSILFEYEKENNTIRDTLLAALAAGADLINANLSVIKNDFFVVLLHAIPEISFLRQNIIEGKIDGSTYDGECACLSGTLENAAKKNNGPLESKIVNQILGCRDSGRPIERFFLGIRPGDTPYTNQFSRLALEWLDEFSGLIQPSEAIINS